MPTRQAIRPRDWRRWISSAPQPAASFGRARSGPIASHISRLRAAPAAGSQAVRPAATTCGPSGNAVNLEDEMIKVAANQMDYQAATTLYTRSLGLIKTAIGKR